MASGDGELQYVVCRIPAEIDLSGADSREGDKVELGKDGEADFDVTKRNVGTFEGDLESERRSCLKAEAGSTWCI